MEEFLIDPNLIARKILSFILVDTGLNVWTH